ncbi:hypothetical protein [Paramagnetospirillum magneticum]|uniref:hypothetical protein n=1 Tax=Paramagnetospirillum magneticum TaxID=84159 RepID=UPI0011D03F30|nr:hypothetical protein [Paramagnetospirillum magneticum]
MSDRSWRILLKKTQQNQKYLNNIAGWDRKYIFLRMTICNFEYNNILPDFVFLNAIGANSPRHRTHAPYEFRESNMVGVVVIWTCGLVWCHLPDAAAFCRQSLPFRLPGKTML